ncbi:hypothetical protein [Legionella drancourtii]|nr:hypothetical protein [Legionella drancourtii]
MQPKYQLEPITKAELQGLSNIELCDRMEETLINILYESYPDSIIENFPRESIRDFFHTETIQRLPSEHQRNALRKCFEYLIQLEYLKRVGGWSNKEVFNQSYDENCSWKSPRVIQQLNI